MKTLERSTLGLVFLGLALLPLQADIDILANSDFSNGKAHWKGDAEEASASVADGGLGNGAASNGLILNLKPHSWTSISQTFNTSESKLALSITYKTSSDYKLGWLATDGIIGPLGGFLGIRLRGNPGPMPADSVLVVIADLAQNAVIFQPLNLKASDDFTTASIQMDGLMEHEEKTLYIIFPDATGTVNITNISLNKVATSDAAPDNPIQN